MKKVDDLLESYMGIRDTELGKDCLILNLFSSPYYYYSAGLSRIKAHKKNKAPK